MVTQLTRWAAITIVVCGGILALSGEWTSPLMLVFAGGVSALVLYALLAMPPGLASERFKPPTPGADPVALRWIRITAIATVVVSPLDGGRFHWSPPIPDAVRVAALIGTLGAFFLCFRSMIVNRFFSAVIRIQDDRGHRVVDSGPYGIIRHPGYAGMLLGVPLMAIALGSWLGFVCALAYSVLILRRIAVEDRFLQANLPGYREYAQRVGSRLLPGVW